MKLMTPVELPSGLPPVTHAQRLLLMGSCFAENIGTLLADHKFRMDLNPFGILYNPLSVSAALREIRMGKKYTETDLFFYRERWHSPMHHGSFSAATPAATLEDINTQLEQAHNHLSGLDWLMLTFGTAYVYEQKETGRVVANCHKQPERCFDRRCLSVEEIVADYTALLTELWAGNPRLKVLCTVSPIRHLRDGLHNNQLSKATLLLAIDRLQALFPQSVFYFPSYEMMMDELRDYRYYADDMLHPSPLAVRYLWERFTAVFFTEETREMMEACDVIRKALAHKSFHPGSEEHKRFLGQIVLKIEQLTRKYPYLDFEKETEPCLIQLKQ